MGREKALLRLGSRTMLGQIRASAQTLGLPVRIIRRDLVLRCGPLGGIYTGLKTSREEAELFLACDMPFVSTDLLLGFLDWFRAHRKPVFFTVGRQASFPFLLPQLSLPVVREQLLKKKFSLQMLARALHAQLLAPPARRKHELFNVNSASEWQVARERWKKEHATNAKQINRPEQNPRGKK